MCQVTSFEEIKYDSVFIPVMLDIEDQYLPENIQRVTIEAGQYAVIAFSIDLDNYQEMYIKLRQYVENHRLKVASHTLEYFYPLSYKMNNASQFDIELKIKIIE